MGPGLATSHAPLLAASGSTLTAVVVTIVVLLLLGLVFWSFLRRGSVSGIAPLAVDRRAAPRVPEPVDPDLSPGSDSVSGSDSVRGSDPGTSDPRTPSTSA